MPSQTFNFTGGPQTFVVPSWVSFLTVQIAGAQGQDSAFGFGLGGNGGSVTATIPVVPNSTLTVVIGGRNGFNGGGLASAPAGDARAAGGGGGRSDIAGPGGLGPANLMISAGGGGGAGGSHGVSPGGVGGNGGGGGGTTAIAGQRGPDGGTGNFGGFGGGGGTPSAGGAGGAGNTVAWATLGAGTAGGGSTGGTGGPGATGGSTNGSPGGGGGGGAFAGGGGGGGAAAPNGNTGGGGGGGASKIYDPSSAINVQHLASSRIGDGFATLTWGSPQDTAPISLTPVSGAIVTTNTPTLGATIVAQGVARQRVQWQLATSSDFVSNLKIITEPTTDLKVSGVATEDVPLASKLFQGSWYMRALTLDEGGTASPFSVVQQFTVAHAPAASPQSPSSGQTVAYSALGLTISWLFSDPSPDDSQSAYQVVVVDAATNASVADTGKVLSLTKTANVVIPTAYKNATLSWRVRVWDQDNVAGNYTNPTTFSVGDAPAVTVATMTTVATSSPTITFTFTPVVAPLATYRVTITKDSDSSLVYDSGWVSP